MSQTLRLATGLSAAMGSDYRATTNELIFVERGSPRVHDGKLSGVSLSPASTVLNQGTATMHYMVNPPMFFDFDAGSLTTNLGAADMIWTQYGPIYITTLPGNIPAAADLGRVDFDALTGGYLSSLIYQRSYVSGEADNVFAVHTNGGAYAKVKVNSSGVDLTFQWVTYAVDPAYSVLGTGYAQPQDVKLSTDGRSAYVVEDNGDLLRVSLANANRSAATVVALGLVRPRQFVLDEPNMAAYVLTAGAGEMGGGIWRVELNGRDRKSEMVSGIDGGIGLAIDPGLNWAYVSQGGTVRPIPLSGHGMGQTLISGLREPGYLSWADPAKTVLLVPAGGVLPGRVLEVNTTGGSKTLVTFAGIEPRSVTLLDSGMLVVCCDTEIRELDISAALAPRPPAVHVAAAV